MKKSISLIFIMIFSLAFANAQISIMPYGRMDFSNAITTPRNEHGQRHIEFYEIERAFRYSATYGLDLTYDIGFVWSLKTGFMYQEMGSREEKFYIQTSDTTLEGREYISSYNYINIPFQLQRNFWIKDNLTTFYSFGTALSWNMSNQQIAYHYDMENNTVDQFKHTITRRSQLPNNFNIVGILTFGFKYFLTENLLLQTFLEGNITIRPTLQSLSFNHRHFNIGLGFGLGYSI